MWTAHCEHLAGGGGVRFGLVFWTERPATFADAVQGWQDDTDFRSLFNRYRISPDRKCCGICSQNEASPRPRP